MDAIKPPKDLQLNQSNKPLIHYIVYKNTVNIIKIHMLNHVNELLHVLLVH